jgi:hypothetical protein
MYPYVAFTLFALTAIFWDRGVKEITAERCLNCLDPFLAPGRSLPSENPSRQKVAGSTGTRSQARPDNLPRWPVSLSRLSSKFLTPEGLTQGERVRPPFDGPNESLRRCGGS